MRAFPVSTLRLNSALLLLQTLAVQAQVPEIQPLGLLPGGHYPGITALSGDGSTVVGTRQALQYGDERAFRWTQSDGFEWLDGGRSGAHSVSFDGNTVVGWEVNNGAVRWTQAGGLQSLNVHQPIGLWFSQANDISNNGTIVGHARGTMSISGYVHFVYRPFSWTEANGVTWLPTLPPHYPGASANVITGDGQMIFGNEGGGLDVLDELAWLDPPGQPPISLGFACTDAGATGIAAGVVTTGHQDWFPALWTESNGLEHFDHATDPETNQQLFEYPFTVEGVTADGTMFVGQRVPPTSPIDEMGTLSPGFSWRPEQFVVGPWFRPFVWTRSGDYQWLDNFLASHGVDLTGWTLYTATDVSDDGRTIIGDGVFNGVPQPFIATVPEPGTAALTASVLAILSLSRLAKRVRYQEV